MYKLALVMTIKFLLICLALIACLEIVAVIITAIKMYLGNVAICILLVLPLPIAIYFIFLRDIKNDPFNR